MWASQVVASGSFALPGGDVTILCWIWPSLCFWRRTAPYFRRASGTVIRTQRVPRITRKEHFPDSALALTVTVFFFLTTDCCDPVSAKSGSEYSSSALAGGPTSSHATAPDAVAAALGTPARFHVIHRGRINRVHGRCIAQGQGPCRAAFGGHCRSTLISVRPRP